MNKLKINLVLLLLLSLFVSSCNREDDGVEIVDAESFASYLTDEMEIQNLPALSVLVFKENEVLEEKYLGQSQIAQNIPLAKDHLFLLASVSKMITATALMQLHQQGLFALDDKVNDFLSFQVRVPDFSTPITFRMLLTHTSAIADGSALDDQYYYGQDSPVTLKYFLENYLTTSGTLYDAKDNFHNFDPGTASEYSNVGNALIGLLVEEIAQQDFNAYCKEHIFQPLRMTNTYWRLEEIAQASKTIVQPYEYKNGDFNSIEHYTFTDYPNGGLRSTATDLFYFLRAFVQNGISNNYELLQPGIIDQMLTPQIPSIDQEMGLHIFRLDEANNLWGHDGGEQGVATIMAFNPSTKVGVIVLTNEGEADLDDILVEAYRFGLSR